METRTIRLDQAENKLFRDFAKAMGISVTELIKQCVFEKIANTPQSELKPRCNPVAEKLLKKIGA